MEGQAGSLVVDIPPSTDRVQGSGAELAKKNIRFVDAPVSAASPKPSTDSVHHVRGKQADFDELAILKCMGASVVLCGTSAPAT